MAQSSYPARIRLFDYMKKPAGPGLYVHFPFCLSICKYCDFPRVKFDPSLVDSYLDFLDRAFAMVPDEYRSRPFGSVYVGGGTPSTAPARFWDSLKAFVESLPMVQGFEFTVEVNPEDVTPELASRLVQTGVNRVSMGAQTFDTPERLGRRHSARRPAEAVGVLRDAGVPEITVDMMFALPDQDRDVLARDIDTVVSLNPDHISYYGLMVVEGTPLHTLVQWGMQVPGEDEWASMYSMVEQRLLAAGYWHYEISNYARPGRESAHNLLYWSGGDYLGMGAGAGSRWGRFRWYDPFPPERYAVSGQWTDTVPPWAVEVERLTDDQILDEAVMTALRYLGGVRLDHLVEHCPDAMDELRNLGLLMISDDGWILPSSDGQLLLNVIVDRLTRSCR